MPTPQFAPRRLQRAPGWIAGVCSGLAAYFGVNVWFVRFVIVALTVSTGYGLIAYVLLWVWMPAFDPAALTGSDSERADVRKRSTAAYLVGALGTLVSVLKVIATVAEGAGHVSTIWTNVEKVASALSPSEMAPEVSPIDEPSVVPRAATRVQSLTAVDPPRALDRTGHQHVYVARLSAADHCNSNGVSLDAAPLVIRQDRANVHRAGLAGGDREDQPDSLFSSTSARANLSANLVLTAEQSRAILERTPLIGLLTGPGGYQVEILDPGVTFTSCN